MKYFLPFVCVISFIAGFLVHDALVQTARKAPALAITRPTSITVPVKANNRLPLLGKTVTSDCCIGLDFAVNSQLRGYSGAVLTGLISLGATEVPPSESPDLTVRVSTNGKALICDVYGRVGNPIASHTTCGEQFETRDVASVLGSCRQRFKAQTAL